jgi:hypothetical protein
MRVREAEEPNDVDLARRERGVCDPGDVDDLDPAAAGVMAAAGRVRRIGQEPDPAVGRDLRVVLEAGDARIRGRTVGRTVIGDPPRRDRVALRELDDALADAAGVVLAEGSEGAVDVGAAGRREELEIRAAACEGRAREPGEVGHVHPGSLAADDPRRRRSVRRSEGSAGIRVICRCRWSEPQQERDEGRREQPPEKPQHVYASVFVGPTHRASRGRPR